MTKITRNPTATYPPGFADRFEVGKAADGTTCYYEHKYGVNIERSLTDPGTYVLYGTPQFGAGVDGVTFDTLKAAWRWYQENEPKGA